MQIRKKWLYTILIIVIIILVQIINPFADQFSLFQANYSAGKKPLYDINELAERPFLMGMNPHPRQFGKENLTQEEINENINEAYELGKTSMELYPRWPDINWYEASSKMPADHFQLYKTQFGWLPMVYIKTVDYYLSEGVWHTKPLLSPTQSPDLKFNDSEFIQDVSDELIAFCSQEPGPDVVFLGNEINQIYELEDNQTFMEYTESMKQITQNIRAAPTVSEKVKIGIVLSYTQMLVNISNWEPWEEDRLWMLEKFSGANGVDIFGINSYPFKNNFNNPEDIPADYYTQIEDYTDKPIWFTEISWPSGAEMNSTEEEQSKFLTHFVDITSTMTIEAICWISMHDFVNSSQYSGHQLSWELRDKDSNPKEVWSDWMALIALEVTGPMEAYLPTATTPPPSSNNTTNPLAMKFGMVFMGGIASLICVTVSIMMRSKRRKKRTTT
ncbi:MAG: glycosyl hydrolase [Asgard group archaeon]|nr:glycosyl hydrolase [Asgard group archaeon]